MSAVLLCERGENRKNLGYVLKNKVFGKGAYIRYRVLKIFGKGGVYKVQR